MSDMDLQRSPTRKLPPPAARHEWPAVGWHESTRELKQGLEVVEDLPLDALPVDLYIKLVCD